MSEPRRTLYCNKSSWNVKFRIILIYSFIWYYQQITKQVEHIAVKNTKKTEKCYLTQYLITNLSKLNDLPLLHLHPPSGNYDRRPSSFLKSSSLPKPFSQYYEWEHKYEHFLKISSSLTAVFSPAEFLFLVSGLHEKWAPFWNFNFTWKVVQIERFTVLWIYAYITITHI